MREDINELNCFFFSLLVENLIAEERAAFLMLQSKTTRTGDCCSPFFFLQSSKRKNFCALFAKEVFPGGIH
jgi:hypothetical protein